jgi:hypothetical protein
MRFSTVSQVGNPTAPHEARALASADLDRLVGDCGRGGQRGGGDAGGDGT